MTRARYILPAAAAALLFAGASASLLAKPRVSRPADASITLYNDEALQGEPVTVTRDVANLQSVSAREGFDGTANDYAHSLRSVGRWQVCMDAGYRTQCLEVDGTVATLGERAGSISSVRYLGPSRNAAAGTAGAPSALPSASATRAPVTAAAPEWQPMYGVDLYGNDIREITYSAPGSTWKTCKASCDANRQCKAWTYVEPGRTPFGECFHKDPVPSASASDCCTSGIKGAASAQGRRGDAAIRAGSLGDTARRAAESEVHRAVDREVRGAFGRVLGN